MRRIQYDAIAEVQARESSRRAAEIIQDAVTEALWPFKPGYVTTSFTQSRADFHAYKVQVSADNLVDDDLIFHPDVNVMAKLHYTEQVAYYIGDKAYEHYRNLPRADIPDNIILGED